MSSHPTSKARRKRQKLRARYMKAREEAQLLGIIETLPAGAVRDERAPVAPDPPLPHLVRAAIKNGWPTPDRNKPRILASLLAPFFQKGTDRRLLMRLARLLLLLEQTQRARDHPAEDGKAKGGAVALSVQANIQAAAFIQQQVNVVAGG